jgi:guanine deaminase
MHIAGHLLVAESDGRCCLRPGTLQIDGQVIQDIQWDHIAENAEYGGSDFLITPGFIDAHLHLPQFDIIGAHGLPLLDWLQQHTFPAEAKWADVDYAKAMTRRVARQLIARGTTAIAAYATVHHESAIAAISLLREFGFHGMVGQVLMDRRAPPVLCRPASQLLDEAAVMQSTFAGSSSQAFSPVNAAVTPRFAISCSQQLLDGAGKLSQESGGYVQSHLAETEAECQLVGELFDGRSYVDVYRSAGLLHRNSIYGHGIHLDEADRKQIAESGAVIAHCPTANSFLRSGTMHRSLLLDSGVNIAIGSDIGAGYLPSMVRVATAKIEAAARIGIDFPDAAQAWYGITAGNAHAMQLDGVGEIKVGNSADLVIVRPDVPWLTGDVDPLARMLWAWDDRWIQEVLLRGRACLNR